MRRNWSVSNRVSVQFLGINMQEIMEIQDLSPPGSQKSCKFNQQNFKNEEKIENGQPFGKLDQTFFYNEKETNDNCYYKKPFKFSLLLLLLPLLILIIITTIIFIIIIWWSGHIRYWEGRLFILLPSNTHLDYMSADHTSHLSKTTFVEKISVMWTVTNFKIECKSHNFSGGENCNFCGKKMYNLVDKLNIFCEETFSLIFYL